MAGGDLEANLGRDEEGRGEEVRKEEGRSGARRREVGSGGM